MLLITDLNGNVISAWSGINNTLASICPDKPEMRQQYKDILYFFDDINVLEKPTNYKIIDRFYVLKTESELYPIERKIQDIRSKYQAIFDNLIKQKQDLEMMGEAIDLVITEYRLKKTEMEEEIKKAGLPA